MIGVAFDGMGYGSDPAFVTSGVDWFAEREDPLLSASVPTESQRNGQPARCLHVHSTRRTQAQLMSQPLVEIADIVLHNFAGLPKTHEAMDLSYDFLYG
jgi:hypothetical protein